MTGNTFDGNSRGYLRLRQEIVGVVPLRIAVTKNLGTPTEDLGVNFPTLDSIIVWPIRELVIIFPMGKTQ